jgi:hypothetical protein
MMGSQIGKRAFERALELYNTPFDNDDDEGDDDEGDDGGDPGDSHGSTTVGNGHGETSSPAWRNGGERDQDGRSIHRKGPITRSRR